MVNQNQQLTLSPDKKKVLTANAIKIIIVAFALIGILWYLNYVGLVENMSFVFEMFGSKVDTSGLQRNFIIGIVAISVIAILLTYINFAGVAYIFYSDFMVKHEKSGEKQIAYDNIAKMSFNKKGILNKIFNMGIINIDLADESKEKLEYVDSPEDAYSQIQGLINNHKMRNYAQFEQKSRVENILDKF